MMLNYLPFPLLTKPLDGSAPIHPCDAPSSQVGSSGGLYETTVHDIVLQATALRKLKLPGTTTLFTCPSDNQPHDVLILAFPDATRSVDYGHLINVPGLLIGDINCSGNYHGFSWSLRKSRRLVRSS